MIGGGPKATRYITAKLCIFRDALEQACIAAHGQVGLLHAAAISTALRWERASALSTKWFREHGDEMDVLDRVTLQKSIAEASERRDRAIEKLKLDAKPADVWAEVYSQPLPSTPPQPSGDSEHVQAPENAPAGRTGDDTGHCKGEGQG